MYQKYQTGALVLGSRERGEADKVFALYTRDFGLVWARASGVRKEGSLMRYALQHYAHAQVGLVRGKRGWRVAGASLARHVGTGAGAATFARIAKLILRLVHGEEQHAYLFETLASAQEALGGAREDVLPTIELVAVARILYALGYLSTAGFESALFAHTSFAFADIAPAAQEEERLLSSINKAIAESQL